MNFALILFLLLLASGALWVADVAVFRKRRAANAADPWWVEWGASFFPVILVVFVLRSFIVEPFKIPSGSMIPTLQVGDFILVNKFSYGIRLPVINVKVVPLGEPKRGDVMVFRYPEDPSVDYIKRVIGVPGDRIAYQNKHLTINGEPVQFKPLDDYLHADRLYYAKQFEETLPRGAKDAKEGEGETITHRYLNDSEAPAFIRDAARFPQSDNCLYNSAGVICTVPPGHYFMLGDNRDNSRDSRYWGFVPDQNIVGKAFFIWFNFADLSRIGSFR